MPPRAALPSFDALLGGASPGGFLARHWQRRPLLVRRAMPPEVVRDTLRFASRAALAAFAARDDVESRLVTSFEGRWTMTPGPIARLPRAARDWTLLVQGVNLVDRDADRLMRRFDFVPAMRLDDLMVSYAADGGGVGPHVDSYDVFLLQVDGRRRWRWSSKPQDADDPAAWVDGAPLKRLARFDPDHDAILEPGDMLYLPPDRAHEGVALGRCTTASIGFRAPSWDELAREFLVAMSEQPVREAGRYADRGREPTDRPGRIDEDFLGEASRRLRGLRFSEGDVADFVGRWFSEPKAHVFFDPPEAPVPLTAFATEASARGIALDPRTSLLYRGSKGFIAGQACRLPRSLRGLADRRALDGPASAKAMRVAGVAGLLHEWWCAGYLVLEDPA